MNESLIFGWQYRAVIISIVVSVAGYFVFTLWGGMSDVLSSVSHLGGVGLLFILALSLVNYGLRFIRWQIYLNSLGHKVPWRPSGRIYLAGFALTTTPGKAGEAFRGLLLKRWGVSYTQSLAAFVSERLSDLVAVVLLASFGLFAHPQLWGVGVASAVGVLVGMILLTHKAPVRWLLSWGKRGVGKLRSLSVHAANTLLEASRCNTPSLLVKATLLSLLAWAAEAFAFHLILYSLGINVELTYSVFIYSISVLAGAISFLPGGLGGTEAVMVGLLTWIGTTIPEAIAATVLIRFTTLWFAVALGLVALSLSRHGRE